MNLDSPWPPLKTAQPTSYISIHQGNPFLLSLATQQHCCTLFDSTYLNNNNTNLYGESEKSVEQFPDTFVLKIQVNVLTYLVKFVMMGIKYSTVLNNL